MGSISEMSYKPGKSLSKPSDRLMSAILENILKPIRKHYGGLDAEAKKHGSIYYTYIFHSHDVNFTVVYNDARGDACLGNPDDVNEPMVITIQIPGRPQEIKVYFRMASEEELVVGSEEIIPAGDEITGLGEMSISELVDLCQDATYKDFFIGRAAAFRSSQV